MKKKILKKGKRIEICGAIASGKTTLCKLLSNGSWEPTFEEFTKNPFFEKFYADPQGYAFETELTFLLQHYEAIKTLQLSNDRVVSDYSLYQDIAYADQNLKDERRSAFQNITDILMDEIGAPDHIIYLVCSTDILHERILTRGRREEAGISRDYIEASVEALEQVITNIKTPVFKISSEKFDFRESSDSQDDILPILKELL